MNDKLKETGFNILTDKQISKLLEAEPEGTEVKLHAAGAGVLGGFAKTEIMGVPIGAAGVGLLTVGIWDALRGLVGGVLPAAIPAWLVPAIGAMAVQSRMIKGWMGSNAANAAGLILTVDAIQTLFDVRGIVSKLVSGIKFRQVKPAGSVGENTTQSIDQYLAAQGFV